MIPCLLTMGKGNLQNLTELFMFNMDTTTDCEKCDDHALESNSRTA